MQKENLIKSKKRVREYGEVFTPAWVVKKMCDYLPPEAWNISKTILEPSCGNGNFLVEITARKLKRCRSPAEGIQALKSIYGIDILPDNVAECRKRMLDEYCLIFGDSQIDRAKEVISNNIICGDSLLIMNRLKQVDSWEKAVQHPAT